MLALSFIAVMILFMLFVSRNKWEQQAFVVDFLSVHASVTNVAGNDDGIINLWLISPPASDGTRKSYSITDRGYEGILGTSQDYLSSDPPPYFFRGFADEASAYCELSEGVISKTGEWTLVAYYVPMVNSPTQANRRWNIRILYNDVSETSHDLKEVPLEGSFNTASLTLDTADRKLLSDGDPSELRKRLGSKGRLGSIVENMKLANVVFYEFAP